MEQLITWIIEALVGAVRNRNAVPPPPPPMPSQKQQQPPPDDQGFTPISTKRAPVANRAALGGVVRPGSPQSVRPGSPQAVRLGSPQAVRTVFRGATAAQSRKPMIKKKALARRKMLGIAPPPPITKPAAKSNPAPAAPARVPGNVAAQIIAAAPPPPPRSRVPYVDAAAVRRWARPNILRNQFILTEIFQPPLSIRPPSSIL